MKTSFVLLIASIFSLSSLYAQDGLESKLDRDGVKITYEWKPSDKKDPESQKQLCLFASNNNDFATKLSFVVEFYLDDEVVEGSNKIKLCIKPGKTAKGKKEGLCLITAEISNDQLTQPNFKWDLGEVEISKIGACK